MINLIKDNFRMILVLIVILSFFPLIIAIKPFGATLNPISNDTAQSGAAGSHAAVAGNVTEINVFGYSVTQAWQGYFGNVTGTITLEDAGSNVMYNWSVSSPEGEIYASISNDVSWESISCFNWTENGTWLENSYNINETDVDGVNETFSYGNNHDTFYTAQTLFNEGDCMSTQVYDNSGSGQDNFFEEVLLWDGSDVIFASILEQDKLGFDGKSHDFEMLVLEDGHGTDTDVTNYYFYLELQ